MLGVRNSSIRLFRIAEIDLCVHWSWFLVAAYEISDRTNAYSSLTWNILEYLSLFIIVMLHEFGHALACRQVGGTANQIVLWPLGGVAYVNPPPRPGATLWSIAAGPLVNVAVFILLAIVGIANRSLGWAESLPNAHSFLHAISVMNLVLLIFNLLPIYPLDGGQILRALLWFVMGRARSLMAATIIGLLGVIGLIALAIKLQSIWFGFLSLFIVMNCWRGFQQARSLMRLSRAPRHDGFACPSCKSAPPVGDFWICSQCKKLFDTFQFQAVCPNCSRGFDMTSCLDCGRMHPMREWTATSSIVAIL